MVTLTTLLPQFTVRAHSLLSSTLFSVGLLAADHVRGPLLVPAAGPVQGFSNSQLQSLDRGGAGPGQRRPVTLARPALARV